MHILWILGWALHAAVPTAGPLPAGADRPVLKALPNPAAERSALPTLALGADGVLYLSWVESGPDGATILRFASLGEDGWSSPRTIASGKNWFVNWADFPSMTAIADGTLAAHYLARLGSGVYSYGVQIRISKIAVAAPQATGPNAASTPKSWNCCVRKAEPCAPAKKTLLPG